MSEFNVCFCDLCNAEYTMPNEKETTLLVDEAGQLAIVNRGYVFATAKQAIKKHGWEERDFGHICQTCAREEAFQNEIDNEAGAESFVGQTGLVDVLLEESPEGRTRLESISPSEEGDPE